MARPSWVTQLRRKSGLFNYREPPPERKFHRGRTLWDWAQLLIIPVVLLWAGYKLESNQAERDRKQTELRATAEARSALVRATAEASIAQDRGRQTTLETYLGTMADLLLANGLRMSAPDSEVRAVARAQTLATLRVLDGKRRGDLVRFLSDSGLVTGALPIVDLHSADLGTADLGGVDLQGAILRHTRLIGANLKESNLSGADLTSAKLTGTQLTGANLSDANLFDTNLVGARLDVAQVAGAQLEAADLGSAVVRYSALPGAVLKHASCFGTDFTGADLTDADLTGADLRGADLDHVSGLTQGQLDSSASYYGAKNLGQDLTPDSRPTPNP